MKRVRIRKIKYSGKKTPREKFDLGIDMREAYSFVNSKQEEIARAKRAGDLELAETIGKELVRLTEGRAVAIQTVATNRGARSSGMSDREFCTNNDYAQMLEELLVYVDHPEKYKATPLDRLYIPKKDGSMRPFSIPSYTDRCLQALYKLAMEPISEEWPIYLAMSSVPGAVGRTLNAIANPLTKYGYVVEIDIKGCFDNIDHDFIRQISPVVPGRILNEWLKCGYMERESDELMNTDKGVPQGGIISPLLTNLVLDGLEQSVRIAINSAKTGSSGSCFCRYADDMVIFTTTYRNAEIALEEVKRFLTIRGLEIKEAKTRITNFYDNSFIFLNYEFSLIFSQNRKRRVACISIPTDAVQKFKLKVKKELKDKNPLLSSITKVNSIYSPV